MISLKGINLKSAVEIDVQAFYMCDNLETIEFGDRLETIGKCAFNGCTSLKHLKLPSIITIGYCAFANCKRLKGIIVSERLETLGASAFFKCERLKRIAIPLKRDIFEFTDTVWLQRYNHFTNCNKLSTVDLVGWVHKTVASLHMEGWRTEMNEEINRINQALPGTKTGKTKVIRQWIGSVIDKIDHYKTEHKRYVKEGITLLELALWRAKLGEKDDCTEGKAKKAKIDVESKRNERRIICGADIVIKNVLPFLQLDE